MESSYMGGLDGSDPLGKAVIWSRTEEDVNHLNEHLRQQEQERVPFSPLPIRSSTTSTTTTTSTEDTEATSWDDMGLDSNNDAQTNFHILYTGHGSPPTKSKVRQALAQAMSIYYTTIQQHRQRQLWRQQQQQQQQQEQQNLGKKGLPQQRFNVVTCEALDTDTYEDNGLALWETDATWTLPSMSILLPSLASTDTSDKDDGFGRDDNDVDFAFVHYLPQSLYSEFLPELETATYNNSINPPIDLVIYFCNQRSGPLEQDFAALSKLQLPVLPLIIDSPSSPQPALPIPAPSTSDPDYPPSLSSSFSSSSSQLVTIQTKLPTTKEGTPISPTPSPSLTSHQSSNWMLLRSTIATYLQKYHIHCFNVTEIHPEAPGFITNGSNHCCPDGIPSSLCHIMSADEIMHVDQFTSLDTRVTYKLMTNVRKYNERWHQVKQHHRQRQILWYWLLRPISLAGRRWRWLLSVVILGLMVLGALQWMHMLTLWPRTGDRNSTSTTSAAAAPAYGSPLTSGSRNMFGGGDDDKVMEEQCPLSELPHMTMAPGFEYPDADMYHHFSLKMTANAADMDINNADGDGKGTNCSGSERKGARQMEMNQARLVWDQGGIWTLTKTDWTTHVPSPCKMNWDTDMNLTLWINTNDGNGGGNWRRTAHLFTLAWLPCDFHEQQQESLHQHPWEHTYYPHDTSRGGDDDIGSGLGSDDGSISYFALTPYQHDVLLQWWLQIKTWTRNGMHSLSNGAKKLHMMKNSLYDYLTQ